MFCIEHFNLARYNEVQLFDTRLVADKCLSWFRDLAIKLHNHLIDKTLFTLFEKVFELFEQIVELVCVFHELSLNLGRQLVEERKLKLHQVEIVEECLVDILLDVVVKVWLNVIRFVGAFNLLDPHVQVVHPHLN